MRCYKCNGKLSTDDFCNTCGADTKLYKQIIQSSELYYNQGLAMAQSRDLFGAADCLRRSVKLNKNNTKARNLLGLVYFEMGEAVAALSQWVISKNLQPEKNVADAYLDSIQKNSGRLDTINQTIKKYNQALLYAKQGSTDLAIIQLKKVLSLNPNLIKGHQLLALLHMKSNEYDKALRQLKKALAIDKNNPLSLRYMKEIKTVLDEKEKRGETPARQRQQEERRTLSGDDVIIPPTGYRESNTGGVTVLNVVIGIVIGAALIWFLVLPSKEKAYAEANNKNQKEISEQLESKNAVILSLQSENDSLQASVDLLQAELEKYQGKDGILSAYQNLLKAVEAYMGNDDLGAVEALDEVDMTASEMAQFQGVYDTVYGAASATVIQSLYQDGYDAYRAEDFEKAIELLQKAYDRNPEAAEAALLYYLGRSYQKIGTGNYKQLGNQYLQIILDKYPDSSYAGYARSYITNE